METFSTLLAICASEFPAQRPVTRSSDVFFDLRQIKQLSKHSRGWWFETLSHPLWRHCNDLTSMCLVHLGFHQRHKISLWVHWTVNFQQFATVFSINKNTPWRYISTLTMTCKQHIIQRIQHMTILLIYIDITACFYDDLNTLYFHIDGVVQERCNSSALAMELRLSCTYPSIFHLSIFYSTYMLQGSFCVYAQPMRWCYIVTSSLIGWAHAKNYPWCC